MYLVENKGLDELRLECPNNGLGHSPYKVVYLDLNNRRLSSICLMEERLNDNKLGYWSGSSVRARERQLEFLTGHRASKALKRISEGGCGF